MTKTSKAGRLFMVSIIVEYIIEASYVSEYLSSLSSGQMVKVSENPERRPMI